MAPRPLGLVALAAVFCCFSMAVPAMATTASPLFARGYTLIPEPQKVTLTGQDFEFASSWRLELGTDVKANDIAVESLSDKLFSCYEFGQFCSNVLTK
jgi:hypothetical protein